MLRYRGEIVWRDRLGDDLPESNFYKVEGTDVAVMFNQLMAYAASDDITQVIIVMLSEDHTHG